EAFVTSKHRLWADCTRLEGFIQKEQQPRPPSTGGRVSCRVKLKLLTLHSAGTSPTRFSCEKGIYQFAVHIGQAEVAALETIGQLGVIEAQQVQERRVQVVNVDTVLDGVEAELVAFAEGKAGLGAAAGQPHREGVGMVVAAIAAALHHRCAAELAAPDHQRL